MLAYAIDPVPAATTSMSGWAVVAVFFALLAVV